MTANSEIITLEWDVSHITDEDVKAVKMKRLHHLRREIERMKGV